MIPKVFHYCWFGGNPLNDMAVKCIESWKRQCPDYEIVRWDENNFDLDSNTFVREAYDNKKWAFVSDYVRLWVLYNYGGIYLDADVEIIKNLDNLLSLGSVVTGYQEDITIPAALIAAESGNIWIKKLLLYYDNRHFVDNNGNLDMKTNSIIITQLSASEFGFKIGDNRITPGNVVLLPTEYLGPGKKIRRLTTKSISRDIYDIDKDKTYAIHHAIGSWVPETTKEKVKTIIVCFARVVLTEKVYTKIKGRIMKRRMGL